jgi:hypothetical protein
MKEGDSMHASDPDPLNQRVLARFLLAKYSDRMKVLTEFCEKTGMPVDQAEALVSRVEAAARQEEMEVAAAQNARTVTPKTRLAAILILVAIFLVTAMAVMVFYLLLGS